LRRWLTTVAVLPDGVNDSARHGGHCLQSLDTSSEQICPHEGCLARPCLAPVGTTALAKVAALANR
jgi:hypothetical protein